MTIRTTKVPSIRKHILFLAILLPSIQGTQLYVLFDVFNPVLLVMPVVMGCITGYAVGFYRKRVFLQIQELEQVKNSLEFRVKEQTKELQELLLVDHLTGLGNRLKLKETMEFESTRIGVEYKYISLLMIDIDYFKYYNDFYGHLHGDEVLRRLGDFFNLQIEMSSATAIRFGGEEFIIILPDCDEAKSLEVAKSLLTGTLELAIEHEKSEISENITISIGIHTSDVINVTENCECIRKADEALYLAKEQGRNTFVHS